MVSCTLSTRFGRFQASVIPRGRSPARSAGLFPISMRLVWARQNDKEPDGFRMGGVSRSATGKICTKAARYNPNVLCQ
jgi:hypothetical protein